MKLHFTPALLIFCLTFLFSCKKEMKKMDWKTDIENFSEPTASYKASDLFIEQGDSVYFENCSKIYDKISWDFGDGTSSTEISPRHTFKTKGIYKVAVAATYRKVQRTFVQELYCGMKASVEVTYNFSDWTFPAEYTDKNYTIVVNSSLYKRNSGAIIPTNFSDRVNYYFNKNDAHKMAFSITDENADYQVKMELTGIYNNPNNPDGYFTESLGTFYTDFVSVFGNQKSSDFSSIKFAKINYSSALTIN